MSTGFINIFLPTWNIFEAAGDYSAVDHTKHVIYSLASSYHDCFHSCQY